MPQPNEPRRETAEQQVREAVELLEAIEIAPLSRPRVLAAARALGFQLTLSDWYVAAWELEHSGDYTREGNGESEWLTPQHTTSPITMVDATHEQEADPFAKRLWLIGALRQEFTRIRDGAALTALGQTVAPTNIQESERCFRAAAEIDPRDVELHLLLSRVLALRNDWDGASAELDHALRLAPDNAEAHMLLANL
ncbi:MAG: tetratricopeptide repeat protein, partial [Ktedonobacterales bacterium]